MVKHIVIEVLKGFGEKFVLENSGVFVFKNFKVDFFINVYIYKGSIVVIFDFNLWYSSSMELKIVFVGIGLDIEIYVYMVQFGKGFSYVGTVIV